MADPIQNGPKVPVAKATRPARPLLEALGPGPRPAVDQLKLKVAKPGEALPWQPKDAFEEDLKVKERPLWASWQAGLKRMSDAVAADRVKPLVGPPAPPAPPPPTFDPNTAGTHGNGARVAPDGRPIPGAPAPGRGKVDPPGLTNGNSVLRWGPGDKPNMAILDQGDSNGCGTTSMAMILNYQAGRQAFSRERIDGAIRHYDMFTSPGDLAAYAERQGLSAALRSGTTPAELRAMIDQGLPVQILIDVEEAHDGTGLHYEVVTGYGTAPDGQRYFELANPNGRREYMSEATLLRRWSNLTMKGFPIALDRIAIAMKPPGHPGRLFADGRRSLFDPAQSLLRSIRGLTEITNGWARTEADSVIAGLLRLVPGGVATVAAVGGQNARHYWQDTAADGWNKVGTGTRNTLVGLGQMAAGGVGVAIAAPIEVAGTVVSRGVDVVASGVKGAGRWIRSWF